MGSVLRVSDEAETPEPDWAEIIEQVHHVEQQAPEALGRLIQAAGAAEAHLGPTLAAAQELARTADRGIREVMDALRPQLATAMPALRDGGAGLDTLTVTKITGTISMALPPITFAGEAQVTAGDTPGGLRSKLPDLTPGLLLAVLMVLYVAGELAQVETYLPRDAQTFIANAEGNANLLVPLVLWVWWQSHRGGNSRDR